MSPLALAALLLTTAPVPLVPALPADAEAPEAPPPDAAQSGLSMPT